MTDAVVPPRPQAVTIALWLLCLHLATGIVACPLVLPGVAERNGLWEGELYFLAFFVLGFSGAFTAEIRKGRNWARITYVALCAVGTSICIGVALWFPSYSPFDNLVFCLQTVFVVMACVQLVQPETSAWFKEMEENRAQREQALASRALKVTGIHDRAELDAVPTDEPLLVIQYNGYKHLWRITWVLFMTAFFCYALFLWGQDLWGWNTRRHWLIELFGYGAMWLLVLGSISILVHALLFSEIQLYRDRILQKSKVMGDTQIRLADAGYTGTCGRRTSYKPVCCVFKGPRDTFWARIKGIHYDEALMPSKDVAELHRVLAALTGRKPADFEDYFVKFPKLVKD